MTPSSHLHAAYCEMPRELHVFLTIVFSAQLCMAEHPDLNNDSDTNDIVLNEDDYSTYNYQLLIDSERTIDELFTDGVSSYLDERWQDCVDNLEAACFKYNSYIKTTVNCRIKCQIKTEESEPLYPFPVEHLDFYEYVIRNTLCIMKCKKSHSKQIPFNYILQKSVEDKFENRKPYEYLQLCYFKRHMFEQAASAAFTFLIRNPKDEVMISNLRYYSDLPEVDSKSIKNLEPEEFVSLYIQGVSAYNFGSWNTAINYMEESLTTFLQTEQNCRVQCEGPFDHGWLPDFTASIANHFTYCLKCKKKCLQKLSTLNGERYDDLLQSHYNYLQFAYYKVGKIQAACEAVASYLLFSPFDSVMLTNKEFYEKLPKVTEDFFSPRKEALHFMQRQKYEDLILKFINKEFVFPGLPAKLKPKFSSATDIFLRNILARSNNLLKLKSPARKLKLINNLQTISGKKTFLLLREGQLNGTQRFLAEGFAESEECQKLVRLAQLAAVQGDGYSGGHPSPHTDNERFEGITVGRAALLVYLGFTEPHFLELYLTISESAKNYVERYFNLQEKLYFTYTHLVCRSALPNSLKNRTDLSHPVHADNCNLIDKQNCIKAPPAYVWRDYSAIIYLNDDFEGGEFIFTNDVSPVNVQSIVKPRCGRLVAFSAGGENLHGVKAVLRGTRCALGVWFTLNPKYSEKERRLAYMVLQQVKKNGSVSEQIVNELKQLTGDEEN